MSEQNQPVKKFRAGGISASIWRNEREAGGETVVDFSVSFQKRYRDGEGAWKDSETFFAYDLPQLELVVRKAYDYLAPIAVHESGEDPPV